MRPRTDSGVTISTKSELAALAAAAGMAGVPRVERVTLDLAGPSRAQQLAWERRLNAYLRRCGCVSGSVVTLLSLAGAIFLVIRADVGDSLLAVGLWVLAAVVASTLLGLVAKLATLFITSLQIKSAVRSILKTS